MFRLLNNRASLLVCSRRFCISLAAVALCVLLCGCPATPQLGNPESLGAADALWTAVTAKDAALIDSCEKKIKKLQEQGHMSPDSTAVLEEIIANARSGEWDTARGKLKQFVRGQRRPGSS